MLRRALWLCVLAGCIQKPTSSSSTILLRELVATGLSSIGVPASYCSSFYGLPHDVSPSGRLIVTFDGSEPPVPPRIYLLQVPQDPRPGNGPVLLSHTDAPFELMPGGVSFRGESEVLVNHAYVEFVPQRVTVSSLASYHVNDDGTLALRALFTPLPSPTVRGSMPANDHVVLLETTFPKHSWLVLGLPKGDNQVDSVPLLGEIPLEDGPANRVFNAVFFSTAGGQERLAVLEGQQLKLSIWDMTDPTQPITVQEISLPGSLDSAHTAETEALVTDGQHLVAAPDATGVHVLSIDDSGAVHYLSRIIVPLATQPHVSFGLLGDLVVLHAPATSISLYSLADPVAPELVERVYSQNVLTTTTALPNRVTGQSCTFYAIYGVDR
jgi:hypothetical protein